MRIAPTILLSSDERRQLERWARGRSTPTRVVLRSRIALLAAEGRENQQIARRLRTTEACVGRWRSRFHQLRLEGIRQDAPRLGRKPQIPRATIERILDTTLHSRPEGATHWSTRSLAEKLGVSHMTVARVWRAHNLKPHLVRSFKFSRDPNFVSKLVDVVGLYLNPPEHAAVFSVDEKTSIQALERRQTILPLRPGLPEGRSYDYRRHGTIDLFVALNLVDGTVVTEFHHRHRHLEFLSFLRTLDENTRPGTEVHLILDNLSVHKHERVERWRERHPRFRFHFIPTGSSWLNLVESWLSQLTAKSLRRGSFASVYDLVQSIGRFVETYNKNPRPFVWTAQPEDVLRKVLLSQRRLIDDLNVTAH